MFNHLKAAILMILVLTLLTGLFYPLITTFIAQTIFPNQANGSLIVYQNKTIGSKLIGQSFTNDKYFHPRPSEVNYDASKSGGSNLGPTNKKLIERIKSSWKNLNLQYPNTSVPGDLVTASGSGLDPHISPEAAFLQVPRIARARGIPEQNVHELIKKHLEQRQFGILGEKRVNVLNLNLDLETF